MPVSIRYSRKGADETSRLPAGCQFRAADSAPIRPTSLPLELSIHSIHRRALLPSCFRIAGLSRVGVSLGATAAKFGSWRCDGDANRRDHLDLSLWTTWTLWQIKGLRGLSVAVLRSPAMRSTDVRVYSRSAKKVGRRSSSGALNVAAHAAGCGKGRKMRPLSGGIFVLIGTWSCRMGWKHHIEAASCLLEIWPLFRKSNSNKSVAPVSRTWPGRQTEGQRQIGDCCRPPPRLAGRSCSKGQAMLQQ